MKRARIIITNIYAVRIRKEEQMLLRDLKGYDEYQQKVKYKIIPKIW